MNYYKITKASIDQGFDEFKSQDDAQQFLSEWALCMREAGEITGDLEVFINDFDIVEYKCEPLRVELDGKYIEIADLSKLNLSDADLRAADLSGACIRYADIKKDFK